MEGRNPPVRSPSIPFRERSTEAGVWAGEPPVRDVNSSVSSFSFQSKSVGSAKQRHCLVRQHNSVFHMTTSFGWSRLPAARFES